MNIRWITTGPTKKDSIGPGLLWWNLEEEKCDASCQNLVSLVVAFSGWKVF